MSIPDFGCARGHKRQEAGPLAEPRQIAFPLILRSPPQADVSKDVGDIDSEAPYRAEAAG